MQLLNDEIQNSLSNSSWIRRMFEAGLELKQKYGADQVSDFSLGNPDLAPPPEVKKALEKIEGVIEANPDYKKGTVVIRTDREIDPDLIRESIEDEDYTYIGKEGENREMTKTVKIEGMMCEHCEASVKKALLKIDGIENAEVSHTAGTAVITLSKDVDEAVIKEAIEDRDYKYPGIE
jgi:Cu2+-exporting ATPase